MRFGIILNDFRSSAISAIQIEVLFMKVKNLKNPGIEPNNLAKNDIFEMDPYPATYIEDIQCV